MFLLAVISSCKLLPSFRAKRVQLFNSFIWQQSLSDFTSKFLELTGMDSKYYLATVWQKFEHP